MHRLWIVIAIFVLFGVAIIAYRFGVSHNQDVISLFPLKNYDQKIADWIKPTSANYRTALLTPEQQSAKQAEFFSHYFGDQSPWNATFITQLLQNNDVRLYEQQKINYFGNTEKSCNKLSYGANFRTYPPNWIAHLTDNINLKQFIRPQYQAPQRAITVLNSVGRHLPTDEPHFFSYKIAGEGYPFDNLQASVIWAGTPIYILGETKDQLWSLVLTPSFIAWVKSNEIAKVDDTFVQTWQQHAKQNLVAITTTQIPLRDNEDNLVRFAGYIGMMLPGSLQNNVFSVLLPVRNINGVAQIHHATLTTQQATQMPLLTTPANFVFIMTQLIGRPYGWGSMYFYNDCMSELKNLYTPFAIWIPNHAKKSTPQQGLIKVENLSKLTVDKRLESLKTNGHNFMTLVNIGTHIFMYLGQYPNPLDYKHKVVALSYQNIWALKPKHAYFGNDRRAIIGGAVLLPILKAYPEDPDLESLADKSVFEMIYLDETNIKNPKPNYQYLFEQ